MKPGYDAYLHGIDIVGAIAMPLVEEEELDEAGVAADLAAAEVEAAADADVDEPEPPAPPKRILKSELPGVSDDAWTDFAFAMKTASPSAVSASNAMGMFELKPRRLADLGLVKNVSCTRSPTGRMVWVGEFVPPLTSKEFLKSAVIQYKAFCDSMRNYVQGLRDGAIPKPDGGPPPGMTISGVLAVLHRCGPSGLKTWNDEGNRFEQTRELFERSNGIF